jgi:hypothetical protein
MDILLVLVLVLLSRLPSRSLLLALLPLGEWPLLAGS